MIKRNKVNARYVANHAQDVYTDLGFDYRGKILEKTVSPVLFQNFNNNFILSEIVFSSEFDIYEYLLRHTISN